MTKLAWLGVAFVFSDGLNNRTASGSERVHLGEAAEYFEHLPTENVSNDSKLKAESCCC